MNFSIRFPARVLHKLLSLVALRAYRHGYAHGSAQQAPDDESVAIDPAQLRKLK